MSGFTVRELIHELVRQANQLGWDTPVVIQHRVSGIGPKGVVEFRHVDRLIPLRPGSDGRQALNVSGDPFFPYRRLVDDKEVGS